ncbi:hypothetical protein QAD02_021766 [Eretmocerus hayati]|uniref:Uncharacterized protein n=1 Tax=Eretmocerus hayati TaxID=131215 RepID=A0ACC2PR53_9HYME|nr:hypothetical protein QAD02_021766 [Eretmocerus hayati]
MDLKNLKRRYFGSTRDPEVARQGRRQWWKLSKRQRVYVPVGNKSFPCTTAAGDSNRTKPSISRANLKEGFVPSTHSTHASMDISKSHDHGPLTFGHMVEKDGPATAMMTINNNPAAGGMKMAAEKSGREIRQ